MFKSDENCIPGAGRFWLRIGYYGCKSSVLCAWRAQEGPQISWSELTSFQRCTEGSARYSCAIFADRRPSTISMTVLVVVEMFNALNALSENSSLLVQPPWRNPWLLAAIALSMVRRCPSPQRCSLPNETLMQSVVKFGTKTCQVTSAAGRRPLAKLKSQDIMCLNRARVLNPAWALDPEHPPSGCFRPEP